MEVYDYIKEVNHSALGSSVHASVYQMEFKNFIYLEKYFKLATQVNTLAAETIP